MILTRLLPEYSKKQRKAMYKTVRILLPRVLIGMRQFQRANIVAGSHRFFQSLVRFGAQSAGFDRYRAGQAWGNQSRGHQPRPPRSDTGLGGLQGDRQRIGAAGRCRFPGGWPPAARSKERCDRIRVNEHPGQRRRATEKRNPAVCQIHYRIGGEVTLQVCKLIQDVESVQLN